MCGGLVDKLSPRLDELPGSVLDVPRLIGFAAARHYTKEKRGEKEDYNVN